MLTRFSSKPNQSRWKTAKRVLRYLEGISNLGITYRSDNSDVPVTYSHADWAGNTGDRKSTFCIAGRPVAIKEEQEAGYSCSFNRQGGECSSVNCCPKECVNEKAKFGAWKLSGIGEPHNNHGRISINKCIAMDKNPQ